MKEQLNICISYWTPNIKINDILAQKVNIHTTDYLHNQIQLTVRTITLYKSEFHAETTRTSQIPYTAEMNIFTFVLQKVLMDKKPSQEMRQQCNVEDF